MTTAPRCCKRGAAPCSVKRLPRLCVGGCASRRHCGERAAHSRDHHPQLPAVARQALLHSCHFWDHAQSHAPSRQTLECCGAPCMPVDPPTRAPNPAAAMQASVAQVCAGAAVDASWSPNTKLWRWPACPLRCRPEHQHGTGVPANGDPQRSGLRDPQAPGQGEAPAAPAALGRWGDGAKCGLAAFPPGTGVNAAGSLLTGAARLSTTVRRAGPGSRGLP